MFRMIKIMFVGNFHVCKYLWIFVNLTSSTRNICMLILRLTGFIIYWSVEMVLVAVVSRLVNGQCTQDGSQTWNCQTGYRLCCKNICIFTHIMWWLFHILTNRFSMRLYRKNTRHKISKDLRIFSQCNILTAYY